MRRVPLWARWTIAGVVLVVALVIGSGVFDRPPATVAERATALESTLKCPSCQDLSVLQSNAPASVAVRHEVARHLRDGWSDEQIISALETRYGTAVLLTPPAGGLSDVLWVAPIVLVAALVIVVIVGIARRRGPTRAATKEPTT